MRDRHQRCDVETTEAVVAKALAGMEHSSTAIFAGVFVHRRMGLGGYSVAGECGMTAAAAAHRVVELSEEIDSDAGDGGTRAAELAVRILEADPVRTTISKSHSMPSLVSFRAWSKYRGRASARKWREMMDLAVRQLGLEPGDEVDIVLRRLTP